MTTRGQASLPPLAVALLVLTGATLLGLTLASGALASADRAPEERRVAVGLTERLVAADSPVTDRENVLNRTQLDNFDADALGNALPVSENVAVEVAIDDTAIAGTEEDIRGTTIRRLVLVSERSERTIEPALGTTDTVSLPRRLESLEVTLDPPDTTSVKTVRANDRVVLHDPDGLSGTHEISLSPRESTTLAIDANRSLASGAVEMTFTTEETSKATLAVTTDA